MKNKMGKIILLIGFMGLILFFPLGTVLGEKEEVSRFENRRLKDKPTYSREALLSGDYFSDLEDYLSDHLIFRKDMILFYTKLQLGLGQREVNNIVLGKDGALLPFFKEEDIMAEEEVREKTLAFGRNLLDLKEYLDEEEIDLVFVGLPNQPYYFEEAYPKHYRSNSDQYRLSSETLFSLLKEEEVNHLDLSPILKKEKDAYYKTDHHFNLKGTLISYREIVDYLNGLGLDLGPWLANEDLEILDPGLEFFGSRNRQVYYLFDTEDRLMTYYPREKIPYEKFDNKNPNQEFFKLENNPMGSYTVYMGGDQGETIIRTQKEGPSVLIVGESFTNALEPLLYTHFKESRILDFRYYKEKSLVEYLSGYRPDLVLIIRDSGQYVISDGNGNYK